MSEKSEVLWEDLAPEHGDCVIVLRKNGQSGVAMLREGDAIYRLPMQVTAEYDLDAPNPLSPRRFTVRAGRTVKEQRAWRKGLTGAVR